MPIYAKWYDSEKKIVIQHFEGRWHLDEFYQNIENTRAMIDSVAHTVDLIIDMTHQTYTPITTRWLEQNMQESVNKTVILKADSFLAELVKISRSFLPERFKGVYFVDTIDEALEIINNHQQAETS